MLADAAAFEASKGLFDDYVEEVDESMFRGNSRPQPSTEVNGNSNCESGKSKM
jgi:hypothetical protein